MEILSDERMVGGVLIVAATAGIQWRWRSGFRAQITSPNIPAHRWDRDEDVAVRGLGRRSIMAASDVEVAVAVSGMRGWRG
jgi:hypothetical protein